MVRQALVSTRKADQTGKKIQRGRVGRQAAGQIQVKPEKVNDNMAIFKNWQGNRTGQVYVVRG